MAAEFNISRAEQDAFAANSYQKAVRAQKAGWFKEEIVPVEVSTRTTHVISLQLPTSPYHQVDYIDPVTKVKSRVIIDTDDGIRDGVTEQTLNKLKPAFFAHGTTHAGNASQITDGAAALLLTRRSVAHKLGLKVIGKFVTIGLAGVPVHVMG